MITAEKPNNVVTSNVKDSVSFGVKQEGLAHIFGILRNSLYSDKILAVIREYSCNAVDAHTEAGKADLPIKITLPTRYNPTFKVRDFGSGLTDDDIHEIYAFYGESTKRKSNALIGQLGLGSKSAFAYGDNFVITSFVGGVKNTYNAYIDPSQIGKIAKLASEATTEENGVEISLAVRDLDIDTFHRKAYGLFRYFKVRPTVVGANFTYQEFTPIMKGAEWAIFGSSSTNPSTAIMGNIGYPIDNHWTEESITSTLSAGLELNFAIGDLEISASREKLQYTDRTKQVIKDKLVQIVKEVSDTLNARFQNCATLFDAHKLYGSVMDYGSNLYALRGLIKSSLKFKGKNILSADIRCSQPSDGSYSLRNYEVTWRSGSKIKAFVNSSIVCSDKTVLIDNDLNITSGINNRIYNLVTSGDKKVYVLSYKDAAEKQKFLDETGLEDSNFIKLSSLPKISLATLTGAGPKNTKHSSKEFAYDFGFKTTYKHRKHSDYWTQETVDVSNDSGIYVMIEGFCYRNKNGNLDNPIELGDIVKSLATFGIKIPKIYGFKIKNEALVKANANMVSLWDFIAEELTQYFATNKIAQKVADRLEYDTNGWYFTWLSFMHKNSSKVSNKTLFYKTAQKFDYMQHEVDKKILDAAVGWKQYFTTSDKPTYDLAKLGAEIEKTYPLFEYIRYWDNTAKQIKNVVQYVDLIDG